MATVAENLTTAIEGWAAALASDAVSPQPSYSVSTDGGSRSVSRNEWREQLLANIQNAQALLGSISPFILPVRQVLR